jgi:hypothetical protein
MIADALAVALGDAAPALPAIANTPLATELLMLFLFLLLYPCSPLGLPLLHAPQYSYDASPQWSQPGSSQ